MKTNFNVITTLYSGRGNLGKFSFHFVLIFSTFKNKLTVPNMEKILIPSRPNKVKKGCLPQPAVTKC